MKKEIYIPPEYIQIIESESEKQGIDIEAVVHTALKNYLERSKADAD